MNLDWQNFTHSGVDDGKFKMLAGFITICRDG
jgi:hypothetical protein